jgi:hypothetical protein
MSATTIAVVDVIAAVATPTSKATESAATLDHVRFHGRQAGSEASDENDHKPVDIGKRHCREGGEERLEKGPRGAFG